MKNLKPVSNLILNELKDLGIRIPRDKKPKKIRDNNDSSKSFFGRELSKQEWFADPYVPKFLFITTTYLSDCLETLHLFRKAGSKVRQKELKNRLENDLDTPLGSDAHDVASILKQWLRELPDSIITPYVCDIFLKCQHVEKTLEGLYLACLLLPPQNLCVLEYLLQCLHQVSLRSEQNNMNSQSLAVIMTPNLFSDYTACLKQMVSILDLLIQNANEVGRIPAFLAEKMDTQMLDSLNIFDKQAGTFDDVMGRLVKYLPKTPLLKPRAERLTMKRKGNEISDGLTAKKPLKDSNHKNMAAKLLGRSKTCVAKNSIRRGRPNTVATGLPSYLYKSPSFVLLTNSLNLEEKIGTSNSKTPKDDEWEVDF